MAIDPERLGQTRQRERTLVTVDADELDLVRGLLAAVTERNERLEAEVDRLVAERHRLVWARRQHAAGRALASTSAAVLLLAAGFVVGVAANPTVVSILEGVLP